MAIFFAEAVNLSICELEADSLLSKTAGIAMAFSLIKESKRTISSKAKLNNSSVSLSSLM